MMSRSPTPRAVLISSLISATIVPVAGCASPDGTYPSLAVRDVERVEGTMEVAPADPAPEPERGAVATSATTLETVSALGAEAEQAQRAFAERLPAARATVMAARSGRPGTDGWARAQVAIADLQSRRSSAMIALADLDRLYVDAAVLDETRLGDIAAARQAVIDQLAQQDAAIESLLGTLGS